MRLVLVPTRATRLWSSAGFFPNQNTIPVSAPWSTAASPCPPPPRSRSRPRLRDRLRHKALHHLQELGAWELEQRLHALGIGLDLHLGEGRLWKSEQADAGELLIEPDQVPSQALFVVHGQVAVRSPGQGDPVMLLGSGSVIGADACCAGHAFGHTLMAESQLDFIWVPRSHLRIDLGERTAERSLDAMRYLPGFGLVQRHRTVLDGQPCWITDYTQLPQGPVRVIQRSIAGRIEATRRLATDASLITELSPDGTNQLVVNAMGQLQAIADAATVDPDATPAPARMWRERRAKKKKASETAEDITDAKRRAAKKWLRGVTGCLGLQC